MIALSREQCRELDRRAIEEFGVSSLLLMENAGRGAAELLVSLGVHGPVAICCGKGNNGVDGLVMARHLDNHGVPVRIHLFATPEEMSPDAAAHLRIVDRSGLAVRHCPRGDVASLASELATAHWVVDGLFGTGLTGPVRPPFDSIIAAINACSARIFALDIPSGLDCDTGIPSGPTVRASHTASFLAAKKGYANPVAREWLGIVHIVDIGAPRILVQQHEQATSSNHEARTTLQIP